jgi:hypothetical protein
MTFGRRVDVENRLTLISWTLAAYSMFYLFDVLLSRDCRQSGNCDWTPGFGAFFLAITVLHIVFKRDILWSCSQGILTIYTTSLVERRSRLIPSHDIKEIGIIPTKDSDDDDAFDVAVTLQSGHRYTFNHPSDLSGAKRMVRCLEKALPL